MTHKRVRNPLNDAYMNQIAYLTPTYRYRKAQKVCILKKRVYFTYRKHIELGQKCL